MAFFTENFLNDRRDELLRNVVRFQYQLNHDGAWHDGEVNDKSIVGNDVIVFVNVPSSGSDDTVTAVRVLDCSGKLADQQAISLKRSNLNTGLLRFTFPLIEESV